MAKSKKKKKETKQKEHREKTNLEESLPEDENDFGGLPQRDLKKNLGCGG